MYSLAMTLAMLAALGSPVQKITQDGKKLSAVNHFLGPVGTTVDVGGFPVNMAPSPDGKYVAVTNTGIEQYITIVDAGTGKIVSRLNFDGQAPDNKKKDGLYFGIRFFMDSEGRTLLYVSHGAQDRISVMELQQNGVLTLPFRTYSNKRPGLYGAFMPHFQAGLALNRDGSRLYAVNNQTYALSDFKGSLSVIDTASGERKKIIDLPGYPLDATSLTRGPGKLEKLYVSCERDGLVAVLDPEKGSVIREIHVGTNPTHLLLNRSQTRLFVSNTESDTVSVIDTDTDTVVQTILVRPLEQRGLPGAGPLGLSLSSDEKTLYVALSNLDSVGQVDLTSGNLVGLIPAGWYPTAVSCAGSKLLVAVGKGIRPKNPNTIESYIENNPGPGKDPRGNLQGVDTGPNIRFNERGLVALLKTPSEQELIRLTKEANRNNQFRKIDEIARQTKKLNPGIEHVIYIVKENRTYDQFFGDFPQGNGDKSLLLYGDDVVPNQRALARRFVLLDNFFASAEMSADGWSWATAGIASEFVQRNAQYDYARRDRNYDYEGQNNGSPVDAMGLRNVNDPQGGYIWDACLRAKVEFKNYGFYMAAGVPIKTKNGTPIAEDNSIAMRAFKGRNADDFRMFDSDFADSDAWSLHHLTWPHHRKTWGNPSSRSRFEAWNRDYQQLLKEDRVPPLMLVRFGNDHTNGTSPDSASPQAMLADNDFAVGQLVEAVSKGRLWTKTAIVVVEDDAQGGFDHVDGHRSIALVISPYVQKGTVDSRFYNTNSAVRTVLQLLGMAPTNQFMGASWPLRVFSAKPSNSGAYHAVLPPAKTFTVNTKNSYRAADSAILFHTDHEESASDAELADILWGDAKGPNVPVPASAHSIRLGKRL
jgi:YVTN family beta-propeller protein